MKKYNRSATFILLSVVFSFLLASCAQNAPKILHVSGEFPAGSIDGINEITVSPSNNLSCNIQIIYIGMVLELNTRSVISDSPLITFTGVDFRENAVIPLINQGKRRSFITNDSEEVLGFAFLSSFMQEVSPSKGLNIKIFRSPLANEYPMNYDFVFHYIDRRCASRIF